MPSACKFKIPIFRLHNECLLTGESSTPWLTTRRRTCPICKGDVVRSVQRSGALGSLRVSSPFSPLSDSDSSSAHGGSDFDFEVEEDVQDEAMLRRNDSPGANRPIGQGNQDEDVENGVDARGPEWRIGNPITWQNVMSIFGGRRTPRTDVDRDR